MTIVAIQFDAGRYHATPWNRQVNEGIPEWPPSPWRFLRALVAVWKRRKPDITEEKMKRLLSELREPPLYHLPAATAGHTRHYMVTGNQHAGDRDMVFDTFVTVSPNAELLLSWENADLSSRQSDLLSALLNGLPYLGRSESWVTARLMEEDEVEPTWNAVPSDREERLSENGNRETVQLLSPESDLSMSGSLEWGADEPHPLVERTTILRKKKKRVDPPGSRWVPYTRPADCFEPDVSTSRHRSVSMKQPSPQVARFLLDGPVLPPTTRSLHIADLFRSACISHFDGHSSVFTGKDEDGSLLRGHDHAFYLPTDEDGDGKLDHITLYAEDGFDDRHLSVFQGSLNKLYEGPDEPEYELIFLGTAETPADWTDDRGNRPDPFGPARTWRSITPYLLTRHPKSTRKGEMKTKTVPDGVTVEPPEESGSHPTIQHLMVEYGVVPGTEEIQKDGPVDQLLLSLDRRGLPTPETVTPVPQFEGDGITRRWIEFKRYRQKGRGPKPASGTPYGFRVEFPKNVQGPLSLGFGSHFGLGLFEKRNNG